MAKKIDLKELAAMFRMKVNDLAKFMGYSRQALYQMNDGTNGICTDRYYASLKLLKFQSDKIYDADLEKALQQKQERERIIQRMCDNVSAINVLKQIE